MTGNIMTYKDIVMKRFIIKYATIAEQVTKDSFNTLEEAISFCEKETEGAQLYDGNKPNRNEYFWYEVYDTSIGNWNGDEVDDEHIDEASVYVTNDFWV